ncbi:serine/threonine-protein kinase ppk16-like isoform X2 [Sitophilus oryzae]|nr:serine/threonine-protein kinase ppk16-like isoform X2 [Sitophilus oryzae]
MDFFTNCDVMNDSLPLQYKIKDKTSNEVYTIQKIPFNKEDEQNTLTKKIEIRKNINHLHVIKFYEYICENGFVYSKQDQCKYGSLSNFIQEECFEKNQYLHEDFLCRMLYQIALALTTVECFMGDLNMNTIFLDKDYNIKLYNFFTIHDGENYGENFNQKEVKMYHLGHVMFELTTLKPFEKVSYEKHLENISYSDDYINILVSMLKSKTEIKKYLNKILSHPRILLNSTNWSLERCFIEKNIGDSSKSEILERLEKIRQREAAVKIKEQILKEKERKIENKEKKLHILERTLKEKIQQVELHLKRCREGKSLTSGSSKASSTNSQLSSRSQKLSYEELDSTYVSCAPSDLIKTSTKLQVNNISKPQNFPKTLSEKRITFKVSPLKDNNRKITNKRNSIRRSRILDENIDIHKLGEYENNIKIEGSIDNVAWSKENKKYAFDMLRIMNSEDKENTEVKHTYL